MDKLSQPNERNTQSFTDEHISKSGMAELPTGTEVIVLERCRSNSWAEVVCSLRDLPSLNELRLVHCEVTVQEINEFAKLTTVSSLVLGILLDNRDGDYDCFDLITKMTWLNNVTVCKLC